MTNVKKVVAILLAFLMIFSSASVFASAWDASTDDGSSLNIETKFFKQVNGEWVETTKVKPGDTVEARVYLGTDYYSNDSTLLFFYDKDFFTHEYTAAPVDYTAGSENTVINGDSSFVTANGVTARVAADPGLATLISNNYIDQAFADKYGAISAVVRIGSTNNVMYDNSTYILAFTFTVAADASGEGDFFVKDTTVQSSDRKRATVNVPKGPADGTDADIWAMRLWDADVTLSSQPVSTQSSVTFNANTGIFANGEETYVAEGAIDSEIVASDIPAVTKDGYAFMGWINAADTTPTYEETISAPATIPENDLVLNAYWMETVDITFETDGGSDIPAITGAKPYDKFAEIEAPTKAGYTFVGWDVRGNMDLPETYPAVDTTYTAIWAKDVIVSFNTNGAEEIEAIPGVAGEDFSEHKAELEKPENEPAKAGYYFIGWSPALPTVFPEQDTTYTAEFEAFSYDVIYIVDGKPVAQTQLEYGMPIPTVVPIIEVTEGMELNGWYTDADCTAALPAGATMPAIADSYYYLYAKTTPATYNAIFTVDGKVYATVPTVYDTDIVAPGDEDSEYNVPAKEGYVFAGWDPYPGTMDEANDMYFEAMWTEAINTLTYVVDGGVYEQFTEENGIAFGMDLEIPADPDKEGYTFLGWAETADATEAIVLPEKMPADSMTYYAVFEINTYKVTFNTADGAFEDDSTKLEVPYEFNADVEKPEVPTKTGYTFSAWVDDETGVKYDAKTAFPKMIAKDVSYTAEYTINSYTATFISEGTTVEEKSYNYNTAVNKPANNPVKTGYTFVAWVGADGTEYDKDTALPVMGTEDVTYTAKFTINSYKATFISEGTKVEEKSYNYNVAVNKPANDPVKTGYTFVAWVGADGTEYDKDTALPVMGTEDVTYTAKFTINSYKATFISEGTKVEEKSYNYNTAVNKPANDPVKTGYTFVAWVGADGTEYDKDTALPVMGTEDVTYTAKFTINSYKVTWVFDNGVTADQVNTYEYDKAVAMAAKPEKTGHTFAGWKYSETGAVYDDGAEIPAMIAKDVTYTAQWTVNTYTVTWIYNDDGVTADVEKQYAYGAKIDVPEDPATKVGHKFLAWTPAVDPTMPAYDVEYTATWEALPYIATFDANGGAWKDGDVKKEVSTIYGQDIEEPETNPEMTGYVFDGWTPEVGTMDNVNGLTFTAKWAKATNTKYTVNIHTMNTEGGYDVSTSTPTGETEAFVDVTPASVEPGFKFNADASTVTGNIKPDGTLVLDVYIDRETYTFTTIVAGEEPTTTPVLYGATVVMPAEVEKVGYTFDGWYSGNTKYAAGASTTMPVGGLTVEAKWTANEVPFKVVVNYTDAATGAHAEETELSGTADYAIVFVDEIPETEAENTIYLIKGDFAVNHYTLDEAASDLEGTVAPDGSTVLNLYYTADKYVITFDADTGAFTDDEKVKTAELAYNTLIKENAPADPVKLGYTFTGWGGLTDAMRVGGNRTFTAQFEADPQTITWVIDDGNTQTQNYVTDAPVTAPATGDKAGHIFRGWSEVEGGTTPVTIPAYMPAESKTYYAIWEIQQYTVTFYQEKGSEVVVFTTTADYGTEYAVPTTTKTGHDFANWLDAATDTAVSFADGKATIPAKNTEYYATWTINKYKFTFDSNEGTAVAPIEQNFDTAITAPADPVKEGYEFLGWSLTDGENAVVEALPEKMPAENRTYYAVWEENDYTITFDADNGTEPTTVTQDYLSSVAAPAVDPVKDGYTFQGWATTKGVTDPAQKVSFPVTMPLNGATYYAIWVANNYTITFNNDNGTDATTVTQAFGTSVAAPAAPTKEGYTFGGWATTAGVTDAAQAVTFPVTMPLDGAQYFAIWTVESYNVTWVSQGVTEKSESVNYGADLTAPELTRKGYKLDKWIDANGNEAPAVMNDIGNNGAAVTYTAVWTAKEYNAVFNSGDGAWADGETTKTVPTLFDQSIKAPADPEREGYSFNGWEPEVGNMTEEGMIFNATWLANGGITYTVITYTMGTDGEYGAGVSKTYEGVTDTTVNVKPATVADGFKLNDGKSTYEGTVTADGKLVLEVYIDRETYQFNTSVTDGATTGKVGYLYGATVVVPDEETKEGYTFDGWYDGTTKYNAGASFEMPARDVTLTGKFDINSYTVTWVSDNGTADQTVTYEYNKAVAMAAKPEKTGYTFAGWKYSETGEIFADGAAIPAMIAKNVTYTAQWDANEYTITFDSNEGSAVADIVADYGADISAKIPADPQREGYTFAGWYVGGSREDGGTKTTVPSKMPLNGMALTAAWDINSYTVTFYEAKDSTKILQQTSNQYGMNMSAPAATMEGYTIDKWVDAETGTEYTVEEVNALATPAKAVNFYATWTLNSNTVNFRANGGLYANNSNNKAITVEYGKEVVAPEIPTRAGYTFTGWKDNATGMVYAEGTALPVMIDDLVNYVAQWSQETYTVSWVSDGKEVTGDEFATSAKYGDEFTSPDMEKKGYTFNGWSYNGTTYPAGESITIADAGENGAAIKITADWSANEYVATFDANKGAWADGDTTKTVPTFFDAEIIAPADPVRAGYTFNGWEPEVGYMTEENMTFTADWLANGGITYTVITYTMGTDGQYGEGVSKTYEGVTDATVNVKPATVAEGFKLNDGKSTYEGTVTADGKLTLKVYIDRETYQFNTSVTNGTTTEKVGYLYGQTVVVPADEIKEGWTFDGWYDGAAKYEAGASFEMPARDVTLTGTLTINKYDVIYYVDGVEYDRVEAVEFGTPVTVLAPLTATGYTFSGWDKEDFAMPDEEVKIYGTWAINKYDVIYYVDGVEYDRIEDVAYGTPVTVLAPLTATGYTFSGWDKEDFAMPDEEVKIYGTWTAIDYTVTWADGIDTTEDQVDTYNYEDVITAPADPVKAGYTFKGWKADSGEMFAEGATMPAANVIYTAQWEANSGVAYTVETYKMKSDGTSYDKTTETLYGTAGETAVYAVKDYEGFTFASGTNYNAEANTISGTIAGDGSLVLEVRYSRNKITVDVNGEEKDYFYDDVIEEPTEIPDDPNGGEFDGWEDEDGKPVDFPYNVPDEEDGNITITPVYNYTVKFISDGEEIFSVKDRAETEYTVPTASKTGYTFTGWTLDGEDAGITAESTAKIPVGGATYVAVFEANDGITYKVETYKMATDGVTYEKVSTEEFDGKAGSTATYSVKDYEGFTFVSGTNYDADANTISGTIAGDGTTVLEVRYSRDKITVIVNGEKDEYYYDEKIEEPAAPEEPEGMDHTGWVDEDGNPVKFPYNVPTDENDEIVITPVFTPINYLVTFISDGETVEAKEVAYGSKIEAPEDPAKVGFTFVGWVNEKGEYLDDATTMPAKAVTYTAVFEITTTCVVYYVDGNPVAALFCEYGQVISTTVPGYTVPTGYSLSAWYTDADCTVPFVEGTTYGSGVEALYAKTTANEYKAVFNADGGKFADGTDTYEVMVAFDSEIPVPATPVKEGYDFIGWDPMVGTMDEEGMTFTAIWSDTVDFYTITYYVDYVDETTEPYEVFNVTFGEDFEVPSEPDKAGWKFLGWSADPNATAGDALPEKMPAENLVYYAIFERSAATVTFYDYEATDASPYKGAMTSTTAEVNFGEAIEFPANNAIDSRYWTFLGWSTTEDGEVIDTTAITMGEGVATEYYAVYKKVAVKLVPKAGSTTMLERNGAIESYNAGYTVTDVYTEPAADEDFDTYLIYGLRVNQRDSVLLTTYVEVLGDGYAVVTPVVSGRLGTGTKVEVYDNADTSAPVETFYVVIFGDIDGNARLTAGDSSAIDKEIIDPSWSSTRTKVEYMFRAANLDGNRRLTGGDGVLLDSAILGATIDQITGKVS